jgi:TonB family protein
MQRLWPSTQLPGRILLAATFLSLASLSTLPVWSKASPPNPVLPRIPLAQSEKALHRVPAHISEFSPVAPPLDLPRCGNVQPPEALLTPDPLLHPADDQLNVRVSFIVGIDGHVHSAFVLDSGGPDEDQIVLRAVRYWRYRPALCNGVPTDAEALVRFSIR